MTPRETPEDTEAELELAGWGGLSEGPHWVDSGVGGLLPLSRLWGSEQPTETPGTQAPYRLDSASGRH